MSDIDDHPEPANAEPAAPPAMGGQLTLTADAEVVPGTPTDTCEEDR